LRALFWTIEIFGLRTLLIWGALGMVVYQFIVAIAGTVDGSNPPGCLGRATSGASSGGRELAVGVLADQLPHELVVKWSNCPPSMNLKPYRRHSEGLFFLNRNFIDRYSVNVF
jgi:hypothetical protein